MSSVPSRLERLAGFFIPSQIAETSEIERRRVTFAVITVLFLIIWAPIGGTMWYVGSGHLPGAVVCYLGGAGAALSLFVLRATANAKLMVNIMCASVFSTVMVVSYWHGGLVATSLSWALYCPLFALLFTGLQSALVWIGLVLAGWTTYFAMSLGGYDFPQVIPPEGIALLRYNEICGLLAVLFMLLLMKDFLQQFLLDAIRRKEAKTRAILDTAPDGIVSLTSQGLIEDANYAAETLFDLERADLLGSRIDQWVPSFGDGADRRLNTVDIAHAAKDEQVGERANGERFPVEAVGGVYSGQESRGAVLILRDITERKAAREALQSARDEALEASRAKSAFLAKMSHELRTPLNAVIGYSEMLIEEAEFANQRDADGEPLTVFLPDLERIRYSGNHLLTIVNDILDISKIEAGQMRTDSSDFDLAELIAQVAESVEPLAEKNGNEFHYSVDDRLSTMHSDATKLRQILLNLLSNAFKFTHDGEVSLSANATPHPSGGGDAVEFVVADTGIGMSQDAMETVFEAFTQADSSTTRRYDGTGLGLTITQHFCGMLGGVIELDSVEDEGTTFRIILPLRLSKPEAKQPADGRVAQAAPA